jgi:hypothetical protein
MDWVIWLVVIVLIVAIVWWLMSRGNAQSGTAASREPAQRAAAPPADSPGVASRQVPPVVGGVGVAPTPARLGDEPPMADDTPRPEETFIARQVAAADDAGTAPIMEKEPPAAGVDVDDWDAERPSGPAAVVPEGGDTGEPGEAATGVTADDVVAADPGPAATAGSRGSAVGEPAFPEAASPENEAADRAEWEATWSESAPTPAHHHEYTDPHAPTLPGAESAAAEALPADDAPAAPLGGHLAADNPYGEGSAAPGADGSGPEGYPVKGDAESMTYHDEDSAGYEDAKAGVWFLSAAHAEAAGFRPPRRNRL